MEPHRKSRKSQRKKPPRVPIETYRWEDLRRSRLRGGYPWTHLYRNQFNEQIDPNQYMMMEGMQKSKSASALRKSSDGVDILEVSSTLEGATKTSQEYLEPPSSAYMVITEVPSDSDLHSTGAEENNGLRGSITIQEEVDDFNHNPPESESSDNISQYLDREETQISDDAQLPSDISMVVGPSTSETAKRAKSEEPTKKRKRSIDSSYSRKSLSKLAIMKKLKEASDKIKDQVEKIKVPRLSMPDFLHKASASEEAKKKKPEEKVHQEIQPKLTTKPPKKPVYIRIPLKPPEGETDEFSYLEFGEKREEIKQPLVEEPETTPSEKSDLIPEVKEPSKSPSSSNRSSKISKDPSEVLEINETLIVPQSGEDRRLSDSDIVAIEILKSQTIDLHENGIDVKGDGSDIYIMQNPDDPHQDDVIIILPSEMEEEKKDSRPPSRSVSRQGSRKARAKSAEPERKRKLSLESSYSRISLSKAGILKKFKDAKDKLLSLSRSGSNSKKPVKTKSESDLTNKKPKEPSRKRDEGPLIIHIPLKPPPGETDEFSYLEFEEKKPDEEVKKVIEEGEIVEKVVIVDEVKVEEQSSIESPPSVQSNDVQFIFLTPPSDDELLDGRVDIPETPVSENVKEFFDGKVDDLKKIAKHVVDKFSPETRRKQLLAVQEEAKSEEKAETEGENPEKMVVDEEDGLKVTESAMAQQEQNIQKAKELKDLELLKSSLKGDQGSPILKKKVSFKRRSKDGSKEIYEEVKPEEIKPKDDDKDKDKDKDKDNLTDEQKNNKLSILGTSQSMSVDEEKSYLDEQKIIKSTSLEEDYNRWSKISDHEYEPINPPPEEATPAPPPALQITDTDKKPQPPSTQELQTEFEERFFAAAPKVTTTTTTKIKTSIMKTPSSSGTTGSDPKPEEPRPDPGPGRFQKLRNKLHAIKKPHLTLPTRPKFKKPNFRLPKIPDTTKITLPSFSLPGNKTKKTLKETRHLSTESNAGDSKKSCVFDFRTYPRIFKKKPKGDDDFDASKAIPEFATVPRTTKTITVTKTKTTNKKEGDRFKGRDTIRIPLHPEDSFDSNNGNSRQDDRAREDSLERRMASHDRYEDEIDIDDAFDKENREIHRASPFSNDYTSRWNHGSFHPDPNLEFTEFTRTDYKVTDLDSPGDSGADNARIDINSSESSFGMHRPGVLEEINPDEFFLRQKGISQDDIEVGAYLSSEIREAFKSPTNALSALQHDPNRDYQLKSSNQSLPEAPVKKTKQVKKPKRKKTPHVSQEQISFDRDDDDDSEPDRFLGNLPPARPKRRSKRNKKTKDVKEDVKEDVVPYQETIHVNVGQTSMGILGNMQIPHEIKDPYDYESDEEVGFNKGDDDGQPAAPPRRNRSLRSSLNFSEHDSILGEFNVDKEIPPENVEVYKQDHEYIIPTPEGPPPSKPPRTISRSSSRLSHGDQDLSYDEETSPPIRPARSTSWTQSQGGESSNSPDLIHQQPLEEPLCRQDIRDYMGYAIIDKNQKREPPLPPPRTPPRRKKDTKFFTTPRPIKDEAPVRPLRNYSTLGPARPPRRKYLANLTDEEKESVGDITQYFEIDEELNKDKDKDLQSGEVVQKMRDRPLPAPPRPPRKTKSIASEATGSREDLRDLEAQILDAIESPVEEITVELDNSSFIQATPGDNAGNTGRRVKRELITPTHYSYEEETVTHGSLVIEPLNGARILPDSEMTKRDRVIPVTRDYDYDDETSEIPEDFKKLKNPNAKESKAEVDILKAQKLQVTDLDVDRLSVNELLASKIVVSEIDSGSIKTDEISSRTPGGALKIGELELPPSVIQQLFERLQSVAQEQTSTSRPPVEEPEEEIKAKSGQKKNSD